MLDTPVQYVVRAEQGEWRIAGSGVSLASVIHPYLSGMSAEAITDEFPSLTVEQVHGAIAFYLRHRPEIDRQLAELDQQWEQFRITSEDRNRALLERLRARSAAGNSDRSE
jgi:uncharacterized protein (DUF433 family)